MRLWSLLGGLKVVIYQAGASDGPVSSHPSFDLATPFAERVILQVSHSVRGTSPAWSIPARVPKRTPTRVEIGIDKEMGSISVKPETALQHSGDQGMMDFIIMHWCIG